MTPAWAAAAATPRDRSTRAADRLLGGVPVQDLRRGSRAVALLDLQGLEVEQLRLLYRDPLHARRRHAARHRLVERRVAAPDAAHAARQGPSYRVMSSPSSSSSSSSRERRRSSRAVRKDATNAPSAAVRAHGSRRRRRAIARPCGGAVRRSGIGLRTDRSRLRRERSVLNDDTPSRSVSQVDLSRTGRVSRVPCLVSRDSFPSHHAPPHATRAPNRRRPLAPDSAARVVHGGVPVTPPPPPPRRPSCL